MFGWLVKGAGKAAGGIIEAAGEAVNKNIKTWRGDKAAVEAAIADEQLAVLAEHAAEFAARPERTWWDSLWDGINRAPRPLIVLWVLWILIWPFFSPESFVVYIRSIEIIPEEFWQIFLIILGLYFGTRGVSEIIKPPRMSPEQKKQAIEIIKEREAVILENRAPLVITTPATRKPPLPPTWTRTDPLSQPLPSRPTLPTAPTPPLVKGRPVDIDKMIEDLIKREGGWSNHPADSGKATMWGVTKATLRAWRGVPVTDDDVRALTKEEAAEIYRNMYYFQPSIDSLPVPLQVHVFDIGVNAGPRAAIKMLQQALNDLGAGIKEDGVCGPMTREACSKVPCEAIHKKLAAIRRQFYIDLANRKPEKKVFLAGWLDRADLFAA